MTELWARLRGVRDVSERQLCTGCGACAYASDGRIAMEDVPGTGRRPRFLDPSAAEDPALLEVCPGPGLEWRPEDLPRGLDTQLLAGWGPILEVLEGHASDPEIRRAGSSGGAATALALHGLEREGLHGVLHIAARPDAPLLNHTVLSTTRRELLDATGSRYAPASPCDGLDRVRDAPGPCVLIGKPCDVAAARLAARRDPALAEKLGLTIAIFCAGTPSTRGTAELLRKLGAADASRVSSVRYRGNGWPGRFDARIRENGSERSVSCSYAESWGFVQAYRQWRCYVCADHTGEFADVAVGDPWYRKIGPDESGESLVLPRTERGRALVQRAMEAGALRLERASPGTLQASQPELLKTRGAIWGRIATTRLLGASAPRYRGMPTFRFWWSELSVKEKAQSFYGSVKRTFTRRLLGRQRSLSDERGEAGGGS